MDAIRKFLDSDSGKIAGGVFAVLAIFLVIWAVRAQFADPPEVEMANNPMWIDSATGKPFRAALVIGDKVPIEAPSGGRTGYLAEACWWTADGKVAKEPTWVLLNEAVGKQGPTFCPTCKRLVVGLNPMAEEGKTPPPTEAEFKPRR
jgi:hypothetical protein